MVAANSLAVGSIEDHNFAVYFFAVAVEMVA